MTARITPVCLLPVPRFTACPSLVGSIPSSRLGEVSPSACPMLEGVVPSASPMLTPVVSLTIVSDLDTATQSSTNLITSSQLWELLMCNVINRTVHD